MSWPALISAPAGSFAGLRSLVGVSFQSHTDAVKFAEGAEIGAECEIRGLSVVGPGARVGDRNMLDHGMRVAAEVTIDEGAVAFS